MTKTSLKRASCTVQKPRHCELQVAATRVEDLAHDVGVATPELNTLFEDGIEEGNAGERQVVDAIRVTIDRMRGKPRVEAEKALRWLERTATTSAR